jgi:hypothetical protein
MIHLFPSVSDYWDKLEGIFSRLLDTSNLIDCNDVLMSPACETCRSAFEDVHI